MISRISISLTLGSWKFLLFCVSALFAAPAHGAGAEGAVAGIVTNALSGDLIEGVRVSVAGTNIVTISQRDGSFALSRVPAGNVRLWLYYTGLDTKEVTVEVKAGETARVSAVLSAAALRLDAFLVSEQREGNAAAITRQRNAENIVSVLSMDAYGNVADGNIGNFLQNLPGMSVTKEAGDIIAVGLRGTPGDLNAIEINGTRMASAGGGGGGGGASRAVQVDVIPSEFIKEIEVTKGNTPDKAADSLGGSVNLITKSAFDFNRRVMSYNAGINVATYRDGKVVNEQLAPINLGKYGPTASFNFMDALGSARTVGLAVSGSYSQTISERDRVQMTRPNIINDVSTQARELNDVNTRVRAGLNGKLEWRLDKTARLAVSGLLSYYTYTLDRVDWNMTAPGSGRVADYAQVSRAQIEAGVAPLDSARATAGIAPGFTDSYNEMLNVSVLNRTAHDETRKHAYKGGLEGEKTWGDSRLSFSASYNPSSYDENFWGFSLTRARVGIGYDSSRDATRPVFTQTYGPKITQGSDLNQWTASRFEQPFTTREEVGQIKADYVARLSVGKLPLTFKTGGNYRSQHRWIKTYTPTWLYVGADRVQGTNAATGSNDDNLVQFLSPWPTYSIFKNSMMKLDSLDYRVADALFKSTPGYWTPSGTTVSTHPLPVVISEGVSSGYTQATANIGGLNLLGGARLEHTEVRGVGSYSDPLAPNQKSTSVTRAYQAWYPSIHLRYPVRQNLLLRGSFSTSGARPQFADLAPNTTVSYFSDGSGLGRVTQSNTGLKPQYTRTFDFAVEYYFEPAGVVSVGLFRKRITNFISSSQRFIGEGAGNGFDGNYENFTLTTTGNLGRASIDGVELNYSQQFRNLPRPFNGLSAFANYTGLHTQGTYANGASELARFVPHTYNGGLSYSWRKFEARVTYHYISGFLNVYGATPTAKTYITDDPTTDINFKYKWSPGASFFVDYVNIFNNSPDWYNINKRRITMSELYGARLSFGVSGRF